MLRKLPPTITADKTPEWLPAGWIAQSKVLKRGREIRISDMSLVKLFCGNFIYTQLKTGKKFSTKDRVLQYTEMEKAREKRDLAIERAKASLKASSFFQHRDTTIEKPSWLPDNWEMEFRTGSTSGYRYEETMESVASLDKTEETGCDYISYDYGDEDLSENEYAEGFREDMENFCNVSSTSLRSSPAGMQKTESRARTQCVFADKEMRSFSDDILPEADALIEKGQNEINAANEAQAVFLEEENLYDVVIEFDENPSGLTGSSGVLINQGCQPLSISAYHGTDNLVEKDLNKSLRTRNVDLNSAEFISNEDIDLMLNTTSTQAEVAGGLGDKTEEPLKAKAAQEKKKCSEETVNEFGRPFFFPSGDAPAHSVIVFGTSNATSSLDALKGKNICGSKKRKLNKKTSSSKNIKKKDTDKPRRPTKKPQKLKIPSITQGESNVDAVWKKGSSSVVMEQSLEYWPDLCSTFPFEPITSLTEDDSVIRRYLEQHATAAASADCNLPLPDFGLPNFSDIKISLDEETDKLPAFAKKKSHAHPCTQVSSSSLPSCSSMAIMQQTVAGN